MSWRSHAILVYALGFLAAFPGCRNDSAPTKGNTDPADAIVKTAEHGPVKVTIMVDRREITLDERFQLTVEVVAPRGIDVEMPRIGSLMTEFAIRDYREDHAEPAAMGRRWRREYRLDAFLVGEYTIPEMTVTYVDRRMDQEDPAEVTLTVDGFTVAVKSLMEGQPGPIAFRDIKGPVPLPPDRAGAWGWWASGGLAGMAGLILVAVRVLRRHYRETSEVVMAPGEWALRQLQDLIGQRLIERGFVREFYFRLSMIVRQYIAGRFGLHAAERTTEEFMLEARGNLNLPVEHRGTVGGFLEACDRVKFALHLPQTEEISGALEIARDLVDQPAEENGRGVTAA